VCFLLSNFVERKRSVPGRVEFVEANNVRDLASLSAEKLLKISSPEVLFSQSAVEAKREYRALACRWHPDREKSELASCVFAHVVSLYQRARKNLRDGNWIEPCEKIEDEVSGIKAFRLFDGSVRKFEYYAVRNFELGSMYISNHCVIFEVKHEFQDLFLSARAQLRSLKFKNEEMAVEMSKFLPQIMDEFKTHYTSVLVLRKTPDQLLLADVLAHYNGRLVPIEHIGWIVNVLLNLGCYLEWAGISHNAIAPDTFFVSPLRHTGMLLGGWWYAAPIGAKLSALPDRSLRFVPPDIIRDKRADIRADLELIKSVGRAVLGDACGAQLPFDKELPSELVRWLQLPSSGQATVDYASWKYQVLPASFGRPRFVSLNLDSLELYKEI
jgi:hypothetical protein